MITKMFSLWDSKASVFGVPFFMPKEGMAIRAFIDLVNDTESLAGKHAEDFSLFEIGEFDDEKGVCAATMHKNLGTGSSFVKPVSSISVSDFPKIKDIESLKRSRNVGKDLVEVA